MTDTNTAETTTTTAEHAVPKDRVRVVADVKPSVAMLVEALLALNELEPVLNAEGDVVFDDVADVVKAVADRLFYKARFTVRRGREHSIKLKHSTSTENSAWLLNAIADGADRLSVYRAMYAELTTIWEDISGKRWLNPEEDKAERQRAAAQSISREARELLTKAGSVFNDCTEFDGQAEDHAVNG